MSYKSIRYFLKHKGLRPKSVHDVTHYDTFYSVQFIDETNDIVTADVKYKEAFEWMSSIAGDKFFKDPVSRQMQKYYYGVMLPTILEWNKENSVFTIGNTELPLTDIDELDYALRYFFFYKPVNVNGVTVKVPKALNLSKSNKHDCMMYFEKLINYFALEPRCLYIPEPKNIDKADKQC